MRWSTILQSLADVAGVLTLLAVCVLVWLEAQALSRIDNVTRRVDLLLTEMRNENAPAPWTSDTHVHKNCYTDRTNVTCTFTNLGQTPVTTCTKGKLVQNADSGLTLETVVMCTGKLGPAETRVIVGPWVNGFADVICYKEGNYGKVLDFSKCTFGTEAVDLPTLRKALAKAAAE